VFFLPLAPHLRVGRKPVITFFIIFLSVGIHYSYQYVNAPVTRAASNYCSELPDPWLGSRSQTLIYLGLENCERTLLRLYSEDARDAIERTIEGAGTARSDNSKISDFEREMRSLLKHYDRFSELAPRRIAVKIAYHPDSPNPVRMVVSSFTHASWGHVIFNMIFFLAFATAIEVLVGSHLRYLAIILAISIASSIGYSLYSAAAGKYVPSLGFSGVVVGMIGLSAYLMPRARIRTFIWLGFWAWIIFIPAWFLAAWYIGWDLWQLLAEGNEGSTNIVAHVAGGFAGYAIGWLWLSDRKWLIQAELEREIEDMRFAKGGLLGFGGFQIRPGATWKQKDKERLRDHLREFDDALLAAYRLNEAHQCDRALQELLRGIKRHGEAGDVLKDVYKTIMGWQHTQFTLNYARHYINYLLDHDGAKEALNVSEECFGIAPDFLLDRSKDVLSLAALAEKQQRYTLAYSLVRNAEDRYGDAPEKTAFMSCEAKYLFRYLDRKDQAQEIFDVLANDPANRYEI
jgi:membrane associated rhomboid family serine protease